MEARGLARRHRNASARPWLRRSLTTMALGALLAGCSASDPQPVAVSPSGAVSYEEFRQANLAFVECAHEAGAVVTVFEIDKFGVPDISNDIAWPELDANAADFDERLDEGLAAVAECESSTVAPVRAAYFASGDRGARQGETLDQRWERMLSSVVMCFQEAGAELDDDATRPELGAVYNEAVDTRPYNACLEQAGLVTDLGGGAFEVTI